MRDAAKKMRNIHAGHLAAGEILVRRVRWSCSPAMAFLLRLKRGGKLICQILYGFAGMPPTFSEPSWAVGCLGTDVVWEGF